VSAYPFCPEERAVKRNVVVVVVVVVVVIVDEMSVICLSVC